MLVDYKVNENVKLSVETPDFNTAFQFLAGADVLFGVKQCGNCGSTDLSPKYVTPQGNEYYSIVCNDCRHELKFGIRKDDHGLFPKGWEPPYVKPDGGTNQEQPQRQSQDSNDDIPFSPKKSERGF